MDRLRRDARYALRAWSRSPLFAVTVIATLGLGIGANTAIFSFVDAMLLRPLPFPQPDRLVMVWQDFSSTGGPAREWFTPPDYEDLQAQRRTFEAVTPLIGWGPNLTGVAEPEQLTGAIVSTAFFDVVGTSPVVGRGFEPADAEGDGQVVVLGHGLWQRAFGASRDLIGATVQLNGVPHTVLGVMPSDFRSPFQTAEIWRPYTRTTFSSGCGRGCYVMQALGRLGPGVSMDQARSELGALGAVIREQFPGEKQGLELRVVPLEEQLAGPVRPALVALLGAVGLLLLIACVNIANLLLARAAGREREMAVRSAIGAGRAALFRQLLTESAVAGLAGGAAGVLVAFWGVDLLIAMSPAGAPRLDEVAVDLRALGFATLLSLVTGALFGLVPALHLSGLDLAASLKEAGGLRAGTARHRLRSGLVATEVAVALTLLVGAGLMLRSFVRLQAVDPGFRPENALAVQLLLPSARYPETAQANAFVGNLIERLGSRPEVVAAGATSILPLSGNNTDISFLIEGRPAPVNREQTPVGNYRSVSPGYLTAMGMRLLRGRWLTEADRAGAPGVVVINEAMASRYWATGDVLGRRIAVDGPEGPWTTVVGVVADVRHDGLDLPVRPEMYLSYLQVPSRRMSVVVRTRGEPAALAPRIRADIRAMDADLPVPAATTLETTVSRSVAMPRLFVAFFGFFALVALLLAAIGIYGVTAHAVSQRTREIGVRIAMGADAGRVVARIVGRAMIVVTAGLGAGLLAALLLARALRSLLFELSPADPLTFTAIAATLALVSLLAAWAPARRAASVDPVKALRME